MTAMTAPNRADTPSKITAGGRHAAAPGTTNSALRTLPRLMLTTLSTIAFLVATALFLLLAVGPHVLGYRTAGMLTGSMAPGINPGDVVIDTPLAADKIRIGMIVTYHIPIDDHRVVSHRVVAVQTAADGTISFNTKGDANPAADPWTATVQGNTVWQVRAVVPKLNTYVRMLRETVAKPWMVSVIPLAIATWLIIGVWRNPAEVEPAS